MVETRLLLVDDEDSFRRLVARELERAGYRVQAAANLEEARHLLAEHDFHVALIDVRMPDGSGLDLLSEIKLASPATEVVMLTAFGTVPEATRAMKEGAHDFLLKPCKLNELEIVLRKAVEKRDLERSHTALVREVARLVPSETFVGRAPAVTELLRLVGRVAETDSTVLVRGESGVGKELVARAVHRRSRRASRPFVVVDCASLHENLLQSELFGHERGAYTGAVTLKHGLFEVADGGTLFLDEIAELSPGLQVKLLRVLETGSFRRLGGTVDLHVDVRLIAATNRGLESMMREGSFREDLYYRLNVFALTIPPLRERREDVPLLVEHFVRRSALGAKRSVRVSRAALDVIERYAWPGNVRELANVIERALILCEGDTILPQHLPLGLRGAPAPSDGSKARNGALTLEEIELRYVRQVLAEQGGHRQRAAAALGIGERSLYRKLKELEARGL